MQVRRSVSLLVLIGALATAVVVGSAAPAGAGFQTYSDATVSTPLGMAAAPDGSLWFTNFGNDSIGRVDPFTGTITNFTSSEVDGPASITVAPDGTVWFGNRNTGTLGRLAGSVIETYPGIEEIDDVEVAADGSIWFNGFPSSGNERIGRFDPTTEMLDTFTVGGFVGRMTPHPTDGMWFIWFNASFSAARIRHVTQTGTTPGFSTGTVDDPADVTTGVDGRLYYTGEDNHRIGRMNPANGATASFGLAPELVSPNEIISGPDGDLWFTIRSGGRFGRLDPATGTIVTYRDPTDTVEGGIGLAEGGDGNLWYTRLDDVVGRLELGQCLGRAVTVDLRLGSRPTPAADVIVGRRGPDPIRALGGNDRACGLGGDDTIDGGPGNDVIDGGAGHDALDGGRGFDSCRGGLGRDTAVNCEARTGIP